MRSVPSTAGASAASSCWSAHRVPTRTGPAPSPQLARGHHCLWCSLGSAPPARCSASTSPQRRAEPGLQPGTPREGRPSSPQPGTRSPACPLGIATSCPVGASELPGNRVGLFVLFLLFIPGWLRLCGERVSDSVPWTPPPKVTMSHGPACPGPALPHWGKQKPRLLQAQNAPL